MPATQTPVAARTGPPALAIAPSKAASAAQAIADAPGLPPAAKPPPGIPDQIAILQTSRREMLPALCELPHVSDTETAIVRAFEVLSSPNGQYGAPLKQLSSWVSSVRQTLGVRTIVVGSVHGAPLEAATVAMSLGRSIGIQALRVIVVDTARGASVLDSVAGLSPGPGLAEMLVGHSKFAELITTDGASAVHVLRSGYSIDFAAQYFATNRMDAILKSLEGSYDLVVVNLGNVDAQSQMLAHFAQAGVLLASPIHAEEVSQMAGAWREAGLRSVQYVRIGGSPVSSGADGRRMPAIA
jgi:Mrp family chromosome partitioning ATPase